MRNRALPLIALHHYLIMTPIIAPQAARPFNPDNALCKRTHYGEFAMNLVLKNSIAVFVGCSQIGWVVSELL